MSRVRRDRVGPRPQALLLAFALVLTAFITTPLQSHAGGGTKPGPAARQVTGDTPSAVFSRKVSRQAHHDPTHTLRVNVGLRVRGSAGLDALIRAASMPRSPQYGHYLTQAQYVERYAPTAADVRAVRVWLSQQGLRVTGVTPDNLLVHVTATSSQLENAFGVTINDYKEAGRTFYSNDRDPTVPAALNVTWVSGLSNYDVFKPLGTCEVNPPNFCGYDGGDFRAAYDVVGDGSGQTIGFTLWGRELPQTDFDGYATGTGNPKIVIGQAGNDGLDYIQVDGSSTISNTDVEVALDTEIAHGVAPGSHLTYWLGKDNSLSTLEDVLNDAANSSIAVISNSWGAQSNPCSIDSNMETALQHGVSTGKTFYFATGDSGASSGCSYPAVSQYVVAVGGTTLSVGAGSSWLSETALADGGGCNNSEPRPSWQTGVGNALVWPASACTGRVEPDVSANSGGGTYLFVDGSESCCTGGTSLSTPIWAAASVIANKNNAATGRPGLGFSAPLIYSLATDATTYANDFHDITSGTNGFAAATGWDEATGWGSPDFNKLFNNQADITYTGPTTASHGDAITLSASLLDHGASTPVVGRAITFAVGLETCIGTTDSSGNASCPVTISDSPGHTSVIAVFAGDAAYQAASQTLPFTVLHIPTTVTFNGAASQDFNDAVTLTATLTDNSNSLGIPAEVLNFSVGAESCQGTTNGSGVASCSVTIADAPAGSPYPVAVSFAGDSPTYEASSTSNPFTVNLEDTAVAYNGSLTSDYHDQVTLSATLTDPSDALAIPGKTISFAFGIDSCSGTTDGSGTASCTLSPQSAAGAYALTVSFGGDPFYASSNDNIHSFVVMREQTTTTYSGPLVILGGGSAVTLKGLLLEDGNPLLPIGGRTLTLSLGSQSCTGTTDATGVASCSLFVSVALGPEPLQATFAGDAFYLPSADTSKSAIVFAFPSRGAFVLGNNTVAGATSSTTVTWWANNWAALNGLSVGAAPTAFKGFAANVALPSGTPPSICSGNWTTGPGNSPPPASGVPTYMGVLVASSVRKGGRTIFGNTVEIVVVKVNPGYTPSPGAHGTGTIVAVYC